MPMATAIWLVENTALTFEQIAEFCGLHVLQVRGIADGEVGKGLQGTDPVVNFQLTREEISRCEANGSAKLRMNPEATTYLEKNKKKKGRYTPVARRQNKPDAIAWIIKNYPEMKDTQIIKLIGTTKKTVESIRNKDHWNWPNIVPKDPVLAGFCSQFDLNRITEEIERRREIDRIRREQTGGEEPSVLRRAFERYGAGAAVTAAGAAAFAAQEAADKDEGDEEE